LYPKKAQNVLIPKVEQVKQVKIRIKGDTALLDLDLELQNHGPFKMNIDSLIYNVKFDTATLLSAAQDLDVVLKPGARDIYRIPAKLPYKRLFRNIKKVQDFDSVPIVSDVRIVYSTIFGTRAVNHEKTSTIAVPVPPEFELEKIEYVRYHKKTVYLNAYLTMHNYGKIELDVTGLAYHMKVEDLFTAEGKHEEVIHVKPKSDITKILPIEVEVSKVWKTFSKIVLERDKLNYHVKITGKAKAKGLGDEPSEIEIVKNGKLEVLK
jgi:LEA14-like dessication related protein